MTPVVVDTDVVSFLFKNDSRAQLYLPLMRNRDVLVSLMTEAELEQWILLANWGADRVRRFRIFMTGFASVPSSRDLIPSVGRGNGRSQGEWAPHRGRRCLDSRDNVALRRRLDHPQSEGLPGSAQSARSLLLLRMLPPRGITPG